MKTRYIVLGVCGVLTISSYAAAKKQEHWPKPKCGAVNKPSDTQCHHGGVTTIRVIVGVDQDEVVLVAPDPVLACRGDKVVFTLVNVAEDALSKKISFRPETFRYISDCKNQQDFTVMPGASTSVECTVAIDAVLSMYRYAIKGEGHLCDPEVEVRDGGGLEGAGGKPRPSPSPH